MDICELGNRVVVAAAVAQAMGRAAAAHILSLGRAGG